MWRMNANEARPNHEKLFYRALSKFWEDQLENFPGLEYSASDYHHVTKSKPKHIVKSPSLQIRSHNRRRSQFSIVSDDNQQRDGYYKDPTSAGTGVTTESYDPYRASRNHVTKGNNTTIVVRKDSAPRGNRKVSNPTTLRDTTTNRTEDDGCHTSPESRRAIHVRRTSKGTIASRSSLASSGRPLSEVGFRKSASYKRHVSFPHSRKSSGTSATRATSYPSTPVDNTSSRTGSRHSSTPHSTIERHSSPVLPSPPPPLPRSRKPISELDVKKGRQGSQLWKDETRQVSSELGKICEEAFNRSSVSSSAGASQRLPAESPATSVSTQVDLPSLKPKPLRLSSALKNRPLPQPPSESLGSMTIRELAETRRRLLEHCQIYGSESVPEYLKSVIANLDRLMQPETLASDFSGIRSASEPTTSNPHPLHYLGPHLVNSVGPRITGASQYLQTQGPRSPSKRAASDPFTSRSNPWAETADKRTIRLVSPELSSPKALDKLQIPRKLSKRSSVSFGDHSVGSPDASPVPHNEQLYDKHPGAGLDTIEEDPISPRRRANLASPVSKKWSWFKRQSETSDEYARSPEAEDNDPGLTAVPRIEDSQPTTTYDSRHRYLSAHGKSPGVDAAEEAAQGTKTGRKWFVKMFQKGKARAEAAEREAEQRGLLESDGERTNATTSPSTVVKLASKDNILPNASAIPSNPVPESRNSHFGLSDPHETFEARLYGHESATPDTVTHNRTIQVSQNWFARFFHLKPATKFICLTLSKVAARREVLRILRGWKKFGLKDIVIDESGTTFFGRVDASNYLLLKPVDFAGEFFAVRDHIRRGDLCAVRMTQERGAASSFFKVVETLEGLLKERRFTVDKARKRRMEKELVRSGL